MVIVESQAATFSLNCIVFQPEWSQRFASRSRSETKRRWYYGLDYDVKVIKETGKALATLIDFWRKSCVTERGMCVCYSVCLPVRHIHNIQNGRSRGTLKKRKPFVLRLAYFDSINMVDAWSSPQYHKRLISDSDASWTLRVNASLLF